MPLYDSVAQTALLLLRKYGRPLVLKRYHQTADAIEGGISAVTYKTQTTRTVIVPMRATDVARMSEKLVEMLTAGKLKKFITAAKGLDFPLALGDIIEADGSFFTIRGFELMKPADTPIVYIMFCEDGPLSAEQAAATLAP